MYSLWNNCSTQILALQPVQYLHSQAWGRYLLGFVISCIKVIKHYFFQHHCGFTGCCVGFTNFRFFYLFLAYLFFATIYATYFNNYFIWSQVVEFEWSHIVRIVMPLTILFFGIDTSMTQLYFFYYSITMIGCCFSGVLLYQQSYLAFCNQTAYERNKSKNDHDCGLMHNVRDSLGLRWHLIWLCPFLQSPLPHEGVEWMRREQVPLEAAKNKWKMSYLMN